MGSCGRRYIPYTVRHFLWKVAGSWIGSAEPIQKLSLTYRCGACDIKEEQLSDRLEDVFRRNISCYPFSNAGTYSRYELLKPDCTIYIVP